MYAESTYPRLFSTWKLRNTEIRNRIVFAPTCPTWVTNPYDGTFTDQAVSYYEERAKNGVGMVTIGATLINREALYSPFNFPGLWNDDQVEALQRVVRAVHRHGAKISIQLMHPGQRNTNLLKTDPSHDFDAEWFTVSSSQVATGEYIGAPTPKELEDHEIEAILDDYAAAAVRAIRAGMDGVEFHMAHGYLPWQFLSPLYNHRTDRWGGTYQNRLRFSIEAMQRIRKAIGPDPILGYRINSTSFWDGDLEIDDITQVVQDFETNIDLDYVSLSAGVHHSFIHTPMTYEAGWEREYTRAVKKVTTKPVLLVGRYTHPADAEAALRDNDADAVLLARQMFADPEWVTKVENGKEEDIRKCVAANYCWRTVTRGQKVQCIYNPTMGREGKWGSGTLAVVDRSKSVLVVGGGPAGLEYARIAAARGHRVTLHEAAGAVGGHTRAQGALPTRERFAEIGTWLGDQALKNGAKIHLGSRLTADNIEQAIEQAAADHVVVATGAAHRRDGFQGQTGKPIPGWETGRCVTWDEVAMNEVSPEGSVLVVDDLQDTIAPLVATKLARQGAEVKIVTRWPSIAMDTGADVYLHWMLTYLYEAGVEVISDHWVDEIEGRRARLVNVYKKDAVRDLEVDWFVMSTARYSSKELYDYLRDSGQISVERIGDAIAPRGTYEATFEGHRAARKL